MPEMVGGWEDSKKKEIKKTDTQGGDGRMTADWDTPMSVDPMVGNFDF